MSLCNQATDTERHAFVVAIIGAFPESDVPHHLRTEIVRYFSDGLLPNSPCLLAILCNDLKAAVKSCPTFADARIVPFLEAHAPEHAWGSRERVKAWTITPDRLEDLEKQCR